MIWIFYFIVLSTTFFMSGIMMTALPVWFYFIIWLFIFKMKKAMRKFCTDLPPCQAHMLCMYLKKTCYEKRKISLCVIKLTYACKHTAVSSLFWLSVCSSDLESWPAMHYQAIFGILQWLNCLPACLSNLRPFCVSFESNTARNLYIWKKNLLADSDCPIKEEKNKIKMLIFVLWAVDFLPFV